MTEELSEREASISEDLDYYRRTTCTVIESTRRGKLLSRPQAAHQMAVSPRTVRSWEDGDRELTVAELIVMAERYDEDPVAMFARIARKRK